MNEIKPVFDPDMKWFTEEYVAKLQAELDAERASVEQARADERRKVLEDFLDLGIDSPYPVKECLRILTEFADWQLRRGYDGDQWETLQAAVDAAKKYCFDALMPPSERGKLLTEVKAFLEEPVPDYNNPIACSSHAETCANLLRKIEAEGGA